MKRMATLQAKIKKTKKLLRRCKLQINKQKTERKMNQ